jgi:hypothetical protein
MIRVLKGERSNYWRSHFGVVFLGALLTLSVLFPKPTLEQYTIFRIIISLAAAGVAAVFLGLLEIRIGTWLNAGGAMAVFVVVFFYNPAALVKPIPPPTYTSFDTKTGIPYGKEISFLPGNIAKIPNCGGMRRLPEAAGLCRLQLPGQ